MRTATLKLILAFILTANVMAISHNGLVDKYTQRLATELDLEKAQTETVTAILDKHIAALRGTVANKSLSHREVMYKLRSVERETVQDLFEVLDDEQRAMMKDSNEPLLPAARIIQLNDRLDLSGEQVVQIEQIFRLFQPAERKDEGSDKRGREQVERNRDQIDNAIEQILTDEQKKEYGKMRDEMREAGQKRRGDRPRGRRGNLPGGDDPPF